MLGIVIPTYGHFDFAAKAARSAFATKGADVVVMVVDDASPDWDTEGRKHLDPFLDDHRETFFRDRFCRNRGYIAAINHGLTQLLDLGCDYVCVTNSDVIFASDWWSTVYAALCTPGVRLAGPLTNAPGTEEHQYVGRYLPYTLSDDPMKIDATQELLTRLHRGDLLRQSLNGFCLTAKAQSWKDGSYDADHVFCPRNDFNSKGQRNPTPLMTLSEYELQRRWSAKGWGSAIALSSYVFHYRSVTRGEHFKRGDWLRPAAA